MEEIKNRLIELGFPKDVLNDLAPEDIAACDGALQVVVDITDEAVETFAAPYYSLENKTYTSNKPYTPDSIFWGEQTSTDVFATFSMPKDGENYRGYIAYPILEMQDGYTISSWVNYTHQRSRFQYPVMTAMEKRMSNSNNSAGAFITVCEELQF